MTNRLTKRAIRDFERDQKESGTSVALYNWTFVIATGILHSIGCKNISTRFRDEKKKTGGLS
jgi:hypothetical protein